MHCSRRRGSSTGWSSLDAGDDEVRKQHLVLSSVSSSGNGATVIACSRGEVAAVNERLAGALDLVFLPASRWSSSTELAEGVPGVALGLEQCNPVQANELTAPANLVPSRYVLRYL